MFTIGIDNTFFGGTVYIETVLPNGTIKHTQENSKAKHFDTIEDAENWARDNHIFLLSEYALHRYADADTTTYYSICC